MNLIAMNTLASVMPSKDRTAKFPDVPHHQRAALPLRQQTPPKQWHSANQTAPLSCSGETDAAIILR